VFVICVYLSYLWMGIYIDISMDRYTQKINRSIHDVTGIFRSCCVLML